MPALDQIDPSRTALIIQDLQNDAISERGAFGASGAAAHAASQNVVANVAALATACREASLPVIHVWYVVAPGAHELKQNAELFRSVKDTEANVRGTWGAAAVDGLEPADSDLVVEKLRMNAFYETELDTLLDRLGAETLILAGAWTNMSVEHTARHAADAGYRVIVLSDGTSTLNADWQAAALNFALTYVATIATCDEVAAALPTPAAPTKASG
jgi:gluconolactonase